jgi:hypothetical protein
MATRCTNAGAAILFRGRQAYHSQPPSLAPGGPGRTGRKSGRREEEEEKEEEEKNEGEKEGKVEEEERAEERKEDESREEEETEEEEEEVGEDDLIAGVTEGVWGTSASLSPYSAISSS